MLARRLALVSLAFVPLFGCRTSAPPAGAFDAGTSRPDAARVDAGRASDGGGDAGTGPNDAGRAPDAGTEPPAGALTTWTLADVVADARARVPSGAALTLVEGVGVRADGTIDLTTASGTGTSARWTVDFAAGSTRYSLSYGRYDPGAAWPAISTPDFVDRPRLVSVPDSPAILAAFLAEPTCQAATDARGTEIHLYAVPPGTVTEVRVVTSSQAADFEHDGSAFSTVHTCS
ncbi:MAG: hypothetical protein U0234_06565 [Sandaracinus sp.]